MDNKPIILIADDEQSNIDVVSQILSDEYDLRVAHNGKKVIKALEKITVDLILLDIQMPEMDGFETARYIRSHKEYDNIPIVFLTAQKDEDSIVEGFDLGGNDYITKPFNAKELKARVNTHLQIHQMQGFLEMLLNNQPNILMLFDGLEGKFMNQTGLDFFGCIDSDKFFQKVGCVCKSFLNQEGFFHSEDENWIERIRELPEEERLVKMRSVNNQERIFSVEVQSLPNSSMYIIDFDDVTTAVKQRNKLQQKVIHDALTGAYNREYFNQFIDDVLNQIHQNEELVAVAFLDIDHFKQVNDKHGHDAGDIILKEFVKVIGRFTRKHDTLIRWGGEEFVLIMPVSDSEILTRVLEKLRKAIEGYSFSVAGHITCSIGATIMHDSNVNESIKVADNALYISKESGRNRVTIVG